MLYPACSGVNESMLAVAKDKIHTLSDEDLLATSDYWREHITRKKEADVAKITDEYNELLIKAEEYFNLKKDERASFLENNQDFQTVFNKLNDGEKLNYPNATNGISRLRKEAISKIDV